MKYVSFPKKTIKNVVLPYFKKENAFIYYSVCAQNASFFMIRTMQ